MGSVEHRFLKGHGAVLGDAGSPPHATPSVRTLRATATVGAELAAVRDVVYVYPDGTRALDGVSFSVGEGERVGLVGPNGAGKSTLLWVLSGLLRPASGEVRWRGRTLDEAGRRRLRARVGLVFQDPDDQLFSPTVWEDVAFGPVQAGLPDAEVSRRVGAALAKVGMSHAKDRPPHHLSEGEKKRVAVATVLAMEPELWLLDEPTAGLDPRARRQLVSLLRELPGAQVVATHDLRLVAELCSRAVVLDGGRVVAEGPARTLLRDAELLDRHGLEPWPPPEEAP
jgi:cobalt/nickel transport system ATP-binding protein